MAAPPEDSFLVGESQPLRCRLEASSRGSSFWTTRDGLTPKPVARALVARNADPGRRVQTLGHWFRTRLERWAAYASVNARMGARRLDPTLEVS